MLKRTRCLKQVQTLLKKEYLLINCFGTFKYNGINKFALIKSFPIESKKAYATSSANVLTINTEIDNHNNIDFNETRKHFIKAIKEICDETNIVISKASLKIQNEYNLLIDELKKCNNVLEKEKTKKILENVVPKFSKIMPLLLIEQKINLLFLLSEKNIRDFELLDVIANSFTKQLIYKKYLNESDAKKIASSINYLTYYHPTFIQLIKLSTINQIKENKKFEDIDNFNVIVKCLARLKVTDIKMWNTFANFICSSVHDNKTKIQKRKFMPSILACFSINIKPTLEFKKAALIVLDYELSAKKQTMQNYLSIAYGFTLADFLTEELANKILKPSFYKSFINWVKKNNVLISTFYYNLMRLFNVSLMAQINQRRNTNKFSNFRLHFFNPIKNIINNPEKEQILWQLKYSLDMTNVQYFRKILHEIAPLNSCCTKHYVHSKSGVLVEGNVLVYNNKIITLEEGKNLIDNKTAIYANVSTIKKNYSKLYNVAILYFTNNHTTKPDTDSLENLQKIRLISSSKQAVKFLKLTTSAEKELGYLTPVVITEYELNALANDEERKTLILNKITNLSKKFHY